VPRTNNPTTIMWRLSWNMGASTSWKPQSLSKPVMGLLYLLLFRYNGPISVSSSTKRLWQSTKWHGFLSQNTWLCVSTTRCLESRKIQTRKLFLALAPMLVTVTVWSTGLLHAPLAFTQNINLLEPEFYI